MGGNSSKKKTTQTYEPPAWVTATSAKAIYKSRDIADQEYRPYEGQRVAGLSGNEEAGMRLARENVGNYQPYLDKSALYAERGTEQFKDANMEDYMNPYVKGALDPVAREIREQGSRTMNDLDARSSSMNAFGGSRAALMRSEADEKTLQSLSDLYGQGYANAYNSAVGIWGDERTRDLEAAGRFQLLGEGAQRMGQADVSTLLTSGAIDRGVQQASLDFDYQQWTEQRDWDIRGLSTMLAALQGTRGSYKTETTSDTTVESDNSAEYAGMIVQLIGMVMMSDKRLKDDITLIGQFNGVNIYRWTWNRIAEALGLHGHSAGVIAQENPDHSVVGPHGFLMVNYRSVFGV